MALIEPRTLKGFRDYLPATMIPREWMIDTSKRVYRSYGFLPIDTPALEYEEILLGKAGEDTEKQIYRFVDHGDRRVALRFDLTVPLARFVAQHHGELGLPFKRYHVGTVWRGENTSRGRYREFMQCDFDTIGTENLASDIEASLVVHDLMSALGFEAFTIRVNNRKVLNGILETQGLAGKTAAVLRILDKLEKIGPGGVSAELVRDAGATADQAQSVLGIAESRLGGGSATNGAVLANLARLARGNALAEQGVHELETLVQCFVATVGRESAIEIDPSIARGLDYYTGTILETKLHELPGIGSVCSGGRYDNLAQMYSKEKLPGIGASLGLDRLLAAMEELGKLPKKSSSAPVFLVWFSANRLADYLALAASLRARGIGVELFPEPKKLGAQLKYADRRGFTHAIVIGDDEWTAGVAQVKSLATATTTSVPIYAADRGPSAELLAALR